MTHPYHFWVYTQKNQGQLTIKTPSQPWFIVALFTKPNMEELRCPSAEEWIKKVW
jgi:hypothetical protein